MSYSLQQHQVPDKLASRRQGSFRIIQLPCNLTPRALRGRSGSLRVLLRHASVKARSRAAEGENTPRRASTKQREAEIERLTQLAAEIAGWSSMKAKIEVLLACQAVKEFCSNSARVTAHISSLPLDQIYALLCLPAIGQKHILQVLPEGDSELQAALQKLAKSILKADTFYSSLGGIIGYQSKCLELMQESSDNNPSSSGPAGQVQFHMPQGPNLDGIAGRQIAATEAAKGLEALPHMAEIWPLGGAGDRLGLECEKTGKSVPTAMLRYCGRTLLEGLVRDLQARESLYYKLYGAQCTTPVVIMTSEAKDNNLMVLQTLQEFDWFGRGKENFRVICQPLVPVVSASSGKWLVPEALKPMMKPGGHGAIWKLMLDEGCFSWLAKLDRQAALLRQISNPMAGTDATMLALTGAGYTDGRIFGFASCERTVGASEGVNVLMQRRLRRPDGGFEYAYNVTNVEYTEFERLGISDRSGEDSTELSLLPANTNILYVSLKAAEAAIKAGVLAGGGAALPGMIFNSKKTVSWVDAVTGKACTEKAGRMECTMQNLVDSLSQRFQEPIPIERHAELNTFVVYNKRRRVTSSAKKKRTPGSNVISQTPDGSFLDLMRNSAEVLQRCAIITPEVGTVEEYLENGPSFLFLFHPALGPLWDIIAQKIRGGALAVGSELVLEVAEAAIADLRLSGSLLVEAEAVYGQQPASGEEAAEGQAPPIAGQAIKYQETGSEAIQYSDVITDLAETSGTVVPLQLRKGNPAALKVLGRGDIWEYGSGPLTETRNRATDVRTVFSGQCARVRLNGVVVQNKGIDWEHHENVFWQHKVKRLEQVRIILHGQSEFEASNVCLIGSHTFEVPDGYKMVVNSSPGGGIRRSLSPLVGRRPSWQWRYLSGKGGAVQLQMEQPISPLPGVPLSSRPLELEMPFTYMI